MINEIAKRAICDHLVRAISQEDLKIREAAEMLGIPATYISMMRNPKQWQKCPPHAWEKARKWTNSGDTIRMYNKKREAQNEKDINYPIPPEPTLEKSVKQKPTPPEPGIIKEGNKLQRPALNELTRALKKRKHNLQYANHELATSGAKVWLSADQEEARVEIRSKYRLLPFIDGDGVFTWMLQEKKWFGWINKNIIDSNKQVLINTVQHLRTIIYL